MVPEIVNYTGVSVDPRLILNRGRKWNKVIPHEWTRYQFKIDNLFTDNLKYIDKWIENNTIFRWASWAFFDNTTIGSMQVVLAFENVCDAVVFRMKDGDTAWKELLEEGIF